uniref:Protein zwilch n=1 Tax=Acrobeloides nanus TaxID=290746 RepID=A0A914C0T2_9BILA
MSIISIESIINAGQDGYPWNDIYRLRYIEIQKVPYLCQSPLFFGKDLIIIDHLNPKETYNKNINSISLEEFDDNSLSALNQQNSEEDKENQPQEYNLEGNPLKVTFLTKSMLDGAENNTAFRINYGDLAKRRFPLHFNPLNISEAKKISNKISTLSIKGTSPLNIEGVPLWVVVDGRDQEHHLLLGVKHHNKNHTSYATKLLGCGHQIINKLESLFSQISSAGPQAAKYRVRRVAQCVYDVLTPQEMVHSHEPEIVSAIFSVHAKWAVYKDEYLTRPPATTPVTIHFAPGWMDSRLSLYERSVEVSFLMRMTSWLCDQQTAWPSSKIQHEILEKVSNLIEVESLAKSSPNEQHDYDFTEKLWDILKECESSETLSRSFKLIFDKLCNDFSAMVRSDNISSLAKWLRVSRREDLALPRLEPLTCVQLLIEIGIDRIKRDITTDFLANQLIQSVTDLQPFFKPNSLAVEERATALLPIHLALQYMVQVELHVALQPHEKIDITRRVIQRFCGTKLEDPRQEHFSFEVTIGCVSERILTPDTLSDWSLDCSYYDGDKARVRALVHFAKQVDFEHFASKMKSCRSKENNLALKESGDNEETKEGLELVDLYYCTVTLASILPQGGIFSN